jgi:chemotaxis protein CheY-P-specific phosphatase CheC
MLEAPFSQKEENTLKKYLNLGFAKAAKDLSEFNKLTIEFSPTAVEFIKNSDFKNAMETKLKLFPKVDIIEQSFWGNISGTGFVILSSQTPSDISKFIGGNSRIPATEAEANKIVLQITNPITSACMSNLAEILKDQIDFSPPSIFIKGIKTLPNDFCNKDSSHIITSSSFTLTHGMRAGFLFLAWEIECLDWVKSSLSTLK